MIQIKQNPLETLVSNGFCLRVWDNNAEHEKPLKQWVCGFGVILFPHHFHSKSGQYYRQERADVMLTTKTLHPDD